MALKQQAGLSVSHVQSRRMWRVSPQTSPAVTPLSDATASNPPPSPPSATAHFDTFSGNRQWAQTVLSGPLARTRPQSPRQSAGVLASKQGFAAQQPALRRSQRKTSQAIVSAVLALSLLSGQATATADTVSTSSQPSSSVTTTVPYQTRSAQETLLLSKTPAALQKSAAFRALSAPEQLQVTGIYRSLNKWGRPKLMTLIEKGILQKGVPNVLDALDRITHGELMPQIQPDYRDPHVVALIRELVWPDNRINQGNVSTCGPTEISHMLAKQDPGEYARLIADLLTTGQSTLRNGDTITATQDAFPDDNSYRSTGERLLQSALMQYGHPESTYHNAWEHPQRNEGGYDYDGFEDRAGGGLAETEVARILDGIMGIKHDVLSKGFLFFGESGESLVTHAQQALDAKQGPLLAKLAWGSGYHYVSIAKIENKRVYFHNPIGGLQINLPRTQPAVRHEGQTLLEPRRFVVDSNRAIESMTLEDFADSVDGIHLPPTASRVQEPAP